MPWANNNQQKSELELKVTDKGTRTDMTGKLVEQIRAELNGFIVH